MTTVSTYAEHAEVPAYRSGLLDDGDLDKTITDTPKWSGAAPPPVKGSYVQCLINDLGPCIVDGYFTEGGYLGILVRLLDPPYWSIRRHGYNSPAHLFGPEFTALEEAPEIAGPSIEQLQALQLFAEKYGRAWKSTLTDYWRNGRDAGEPMGAYLRQVRNHFPGWLYSGNNKVVPRDPGRRRPIAGGEG